MSITSTVAPDGVMDAAITTVMDQMDKLDNVSTRYRKELSEALSGIKEVNVTQIDPPQRMDVPETPVPNIDLSNAPVFEAKDLDKPQLPEFKSIEDATRHAIILGAKKSMINKHRYHKGMFIVKRCNDYP